MKTKKLIELKVGQKFAWKDFVYLLVWHLYGEKQFVCYNETLQQSEKINAEEEVNLHWWEVLENPTKIEIMQAYEDGAIDSAKIEVREKDSGDNWKSIPKNDLIWNSKFYEYRIKPNKHIIKIDDKEIEISEKSYKNLIESLKSLIKE